MTFPLIWANLHSFLRASDVTKRLVSLIIIYLILLLSYKCQRDASY